MSAKIKLKRFCLLLSYSGKNYLGMQRNPGTKTVEECLLTALKDSGLIPEDHFVRPQLMFFQRAARTDKSVSAIKQIVSIKIAESIKDRLTEVNNFLPEDIRVMGCKKVTPSFDAKNYCDARTYSYLMPSFALCPLSEITTEKYRASEEVIKLFNSTLEGYVGSHVFHNFTSGKAFKDDSSMRVIRFMYCSEPFYPCNQKDLEFVIVRVKGQSFMMHQIRKMIGLAIAVVKGFATEDHIKRSMEEPYMDIPKAPGLGLMLEEVHFDRYNRKFGGDGHHEPIEWNAENPAIDEFKDKYIYPVVVDTEKNEKSMFNWLNTLSLHSYGGTKTFASTHSNGPKEDDMIQRSLAIVQSTGIIESETNENHNDPEDKKRPNDDDDVEEGDGEAQDRKKIKTEEDVKKDKIETNNL